MAVRLSAEAGGKEKGFLVLPRSKAAGQLKRNHNEMALDCVSAANIA
jgi:hypothetical protein